MNACQTLHSLRRYQALIVVGLALANALVPIDAAAQYTLGYQNTASGQYAVAIGYGNLAAGDSSQALGYWSTASGSTSTAIGNGLTASGGNSLAMGYGAQATGLQSISIGMGSVASNMGSVAVGRGVAMGANSFAIGNDSVASGDNAFAFGNSAITVGRDNKVHANTTVFGDGSTPTLATADYQFMVRAKGGFVFYTSNYAAGTSQSTGVYLSPGSGSWGTLSDRNAKDAVQVVDGRDVLARVVAMPVATWHYKAQESQYRHMGPMAQDFHAAFGLGEMDTGIDTVDADGVALAAIQGLNAKLELENATLRAHQESQDAAVADLREAVKSLQRERVVMSAAAATP